MSSADRDPEAAEPLMAACEEGFEILLEDPFEDDGFCPGLRPRGHQAVLDKGLAVRLAEDCALAGEAVAAESPSRIEAGVETPGPRPVAITEPRGACHPDEIAAPVTMAPPVAVASQAEVRRNLRRLASARRAVLAFTAGIDPQRELKALLLRIFDHLRREHCRPGGASGFERWWAVVRVYRRILAAPELASKGAWTRLDYLLSLTADELTGRRLELASGRRKLAPLQNRKKKRRTARS